MKKHEKIYFSPIAGTGILSIYWYEGMIFGDAIEANNEEGVGWFSPNGEIIGAQFDDINEKQDHQHLDFDDYRLEVWVKNGKVKYQLEKKEKRKKAVNE